MRSERGNFLRFTTVVQKTVAILLLNGFLLSTGFAQQETEGHLSEDTAPLQFVLIERCANPDPSGVVANSTSNSCVIVPPGLGNGPVLLAYGQVQRGSAETFAEVSKDIQANAIVVLQSLGGDLIGGLRLGQAIRARGFYTYLPSSVSYRVPEKLQGKCLSACAYAFLGGLERKIDANAKYGVHQFRGANQQVDPVQTQKLAAILGRYMDAMGVSRQLLDRALLTEPGKVFLVSAQQSQAWRIENQFNSSTPTVLSKWKMEVAPGGKRLAYVTQRQIKSGNSITIALYKNAPETRILVIVRPDPNLELPSKWEDSFKDRTQLQIYFAGNGEAKSQTQIVKLTPKSHWAQAGYVNIAGTKQIWYEADPTLIQEMQKNSQFKIRLLWTREGPQGIDEETVFGTQGLADTLLAL